MRTPFFLAPLLLGTLLTACQPVLYIRDPEKLAASTPPATSPAHSLYLIGDCGKPAHDYQEPSLALLSQLADSTGPASTVLFLGDNVYNYGLPPTDHPDQPEMERRLTAQLDAVKTTGARLLMVPGNHDWQMMGKQGWEYVRREEAFVEQHWAQGNTFHPDNGCPGPITLQAHPDLTLVLLDTQWWLHAHDKPGKAQGCAATTEADFLQALQDTLDHHKGENLVVAAHHPVYTYGTHGGHYNWKYHLFPLRMAKKNLYVPLPVLGSIAVLFRSLVGTSQDCSHPRYRRLRKGMQKIFSQHPNLIYAAGHEHNLQHLTHQGNHYIVSGAGTKSQELGHGKKAQFTAGLKGFARLDYYSDGQIWLQFILPSGDCTIPYRTRLDQP